MYRCVRKLAMPGDTPCCCRFERKLMINNRIWEGALFSDTPLCLKKCENTGEHACQFEGCASILWGCLGHSETVSGHFYCAPPRLLINPLVVEQVIHLAFWLIHIDQIWPNDLNEPKGRERLNAQKATTCNNPHRCLLVLVMPYV